MFETFIERPIFNLLELIYALIPGQDLGISIIIFTIIVRIALWPLVKRQLHQSKAMRKLQPQLKKIKEEAGKDKQKLVRMQMELYKEHGVKPMATIGTLIVQVPIFIALFFSIRKLIESPDVLLTFAYEPIRNLPSIQALAGDISQFQHSLLGLVDLSRSGVGSESVYLPAIIIAALAAISQYYQSRMLLPDSKDARKLSDILKDAQTGKQPDQQEISAAMGRNMVRFMPLMTFGFASILPSALALYFLATSGFGYFQQKIILGQEQEELEEISEQDTKAEDKKPKASKSKTKPKATKPKQKKKKKTRKRK